MEIRNSKKARFVKNVYIVVLLQCLTFSLIHGHYQYGNNTQAALCSAQCEALCVDNVPNCEDLCKGNRTWLTDCDGPTCTGTCSLLWTRYNYQINNLVPTRTPHIDHSDGKSFELTWDRPPATPLTTIYMIEKKTFGKHNTSSVKMMGWIRETRFKIDRTGACENSSFRVMAVNQFGAMGFSNYIKVPGVKPGLLEHMKYSGRGVYYYNDTSLFMAILEWSLTAGWNDTDIARYDINPVVKTYCKDMNHLSLPTFRQMQNKRRVLITMAAASIGCTFTPEVRAVSKCGVYGPWTAFTVDLTNCSAITGYMCQPKPFDPPGIAQNVSLAVSPLNPPSPFAVDLHILWQPPTDLGSTGLVEKYMIRSGKAQQLTPPLPAYFIGKPMVRNVSQDIREMIFQLQTEQVPFLYGVQVIPYAPGQYDSENEMGMMHMETIRVGHNDSIASFKKQGTILYDSNGTVIVYMNKTMPVQFMFNPTLGRSGNNSIDRLALQWGPLVGPNQLYIENRTVVPMNQSELSVFLRSSVRKYGLKMKYLSYDEDEPGDTDWQAVPLMSFVIPNVSDEVKEEKLNPDELNLVPVYVLVPTITLIVLVIVFLRLGIKRQHFKNLEHRLAEIEEEVDENGEIDHYYIMRTQQNDSEYLEPTVVPDAWELPHTSLKIGRTLGSGAFGQVLRGRISRSLMMHRGIDLHGTDGKSGLFVTVAVKMLQEYTEDRYRQDFLNEIKMMKDIGYHRNIVSILGCCTLREPYCLIVEHVPHGDLLTYLRKIRYKLQEREDEIGNYVNQEVELFSPLDLLSVARQITLGMEYLSQKGFVHRDLAARNILVGKNKMVKIGDFGLAKYIYHDVGKVYVNRRGGKLPLKWMSVEAIFDLTFSTASDVWAFGVVLFEIVTLGGSPYPLVSNADLLQELRNGYRMERPENCSEEIYDIMLWCWKTKPSDRPTFTQLQETFTAMVQRDSGHDYFSFDINEEREYYKINSDEMDLNDATIEVIASITDGETDAVASVGTNTGKGLKTEPADISKQSPCETKFGIETIDVRDEKKRDHKTETQDDDDSTENNNPISARVNDTHSSATDYSKTYNDDISDSGRKFNEDTNSSCSESYSLAGTRRAVSELDRLSGSSDEVFMECPGCLKLNGHRESVRACPECLKTRIGLTMFDLHGADRNDSAISSATSDELKSDDGHSPNASVSSSEYSIIPISVSKIIPIKDTRNKISVEKTPSTKYYDEASIFELIKKYPAWTERGANTSGESRTYETVSDIDFVSEKHGHVIGNADLGIGKLEPFPGRYPRRRFSSDPYCNCRLAIGRGENWNIVETRM